MNQNKLLFSIGLLSAAIIAFQLALIQVLSIVQWYHFAYMVISMAMLGFGAAGSVLAIFRKTLVNHVDTVLPILCSVSGLAMCWVTDVSQIPQIRFDSYLLFSDYTHIGRLLVTYLVYFIPFFLGALAIGLVFVIQVQRIGKFYFSNLFGSGAGGMLALVFMWILSPTYLPALIAILPVIGGVILVQRSKRLLHFGVVAIVLASITWKLIDPPQLVLSEYKDLSKTMLLPNSAIAFEKSSPYGFVQMVNSPALRYAPGLSLMAQKTAQVKTAAFLNGDWFGGITDWKNTDSSMVLDFTTSALPYIMANRSRVLVLRSGTGIDVAHALTRKVNAVVAVESNPIILSVLRNQFAGETDSLFFHPSVSVQNLEPRTFLAMDGTTYDLIALPIVGRFGGSSGLFAIQEDFILTKDAFKEMWHKLNPGGVISVTSWMDYPVRNPLKILATILDVLQELGIKNPQERIAAIRSWGTISFVLTRSPLHEKEIRHIRKFCEDMMFDPAILPNLTREERTRYNQFQDERFFSYVDSLFSDGKQNFYNDYDFNIKAATDNKPYFFQFIKWTSLDRLSNFFGNRSIPYFETAYLLVIVTLVQISIASFILILLPLFRFRLKVKNKRGIILYFAGIGLGYMFVEMVFIQRFILYFGNTVYSASAIITSLLIFSGLGSYYSGQFSKNRKGLLLIFAFIIFLLLAYSFILTPFLQETVHLNHFFKFLIICLLTGPLAFCMGIPFPTGISYVSNTNADVIPWAWGINSCISVVSTALATIVSVEMGFHYVMLFAALAYCIPLAVQIKWGR